ncbi:MAG: histidinol-phosphatase HisJ family protein [Deltaproteobacteria bacterium]|nr:histidinol-phosphatase HisJ family protein [Deltaproteobacteria bacterium]
MAGVVLNMECTEDNMLNELKPQKNQLPDYHMHTALCKHAKGTVSDYRNAAGALGIPEICFVDHAPNPDGYDPKHRMNLNEFCNYQEIVGALMDHQSPHVLFGIEADYYRGCETFLEKWLEIQDFDLVLGSVHFIEDWGFDNPDVKQVWNSVDVTETWATYFKLVTKLVETRLFDVVSHLDIPKKFGHRPSDKDIKEMVQPVLDRVAAVGMGMELNTSGLRKPVGEIYPSALIVSLARERDIPICFGSDAHNPQEVGKDFPAALQLARDAGYTHYFRSSKRKKTLFPLPEAL